VTEALVLATATAPLLGALATALPLAPRTTVRANAAAALLTAALATALALVALLDADASGDASWFVADAASGVFLLVIAAIGLLSALCLPRHLAGPGGGFLGRRDLHRPVYVAFFLFWAMLLALPLVANLAAAWLLVEATTAASALLVAAGGRRGALEAGWKYLLLTTCGLTVALTGIVILFAALGDGTGTPATLDWSAIRAGAHALDDGTATVAAVLILAGLAAKIGWAPVHNWLPDAHSEAPPPVSALLSAALLPTVMLVAWRTRAALAPSGADEALTTLFLGFGIASLAVAVPFLWRPMGLKRLLAYSSLEHMGVLALGIGFATPLAIAGVVVHLAGHALAKALGFTATIPLLAADPALSRRPALGLPSVNPAAADAVGVSLATLGGLPPSPLFASELLILAGGIAAGQLAVAAIAAALLALGFLGLAHAAIEALAGERPAHAPAPTGPVRALAPDPARPVRSPRLLALTLLVAAALLALSAGALALPDSALVARLVGMGG
jgi:hydrogenase-4 component F